MINIIYESNKDTIAAIATKLGEAGIGIVKISGDDAIKIAEKIFKSKNNIKVRDMKSYSMNYGFVVDENKNIVDEVILTIMKKPKSYTREDVIEINCHGGVVATKKVLELCINNGARLANPGEFTKRAFLNGRIDLTQAEAVIDIINAKTDKSLILAARNLNGSVKKKIEELRNKLLDIIVELEASIDFIEEDLEITPYDELKKKVVEIYKDVKILIEDEKKGEIIKNGIKISIVGKTNVGKSSLLNALVKKEKAIVTHIPGTTRDAVEELFYLKGIPIVFVDTAGIREAKGIIEKIGIEKTISHINESDLVLMVVDYNKKLNVKDFEILEKLNDKKIILCVNKIDLKKRIDIEKVKKYKNIKSIVEISAKKLMNLELLEKEIEKNIDDEINIDFNEKIIVNERHKNVLKEVYACLKNSISAMDKKMSEEFPLSDLRIGYELLGEITGQKINDEILEKIFEKFCIGK